MLPARQTTRRPGLQDVAGDEGCCCLLPTWPCTASTASRAPDARRAVCRPWLQGMTEALHRAVHALMARLLPLPALLPGEVLCILHGQPVLAVAQLTASCAEGGAAPADVAQALPEQHHQQLELWKEAVACLKLLGPDATLKATALPPPAAAASESGRQVRHRLRQRVLHCSRQCPCGGGGGGRDPGTRVCSR